MKKTTHGKTWRLFLVPLVPLVIIGGFFWPYLGYIAIGMMLLMIVMAVFRGRYYCSSFCAMGAFHDQVLAPISHKAKMPPVLKAAWLKWLVFVLMLGLLTSRLILAEGDPKQIGAAFVTMWTISTAMAIGLGFFWKPRAWCSICPMAIFQGLLGPRAHLLQVGEGCKDCGLCKKVCPIETYPGSHKREGFVPSSDCMRCGQCVAKCPTKALSFADAGRVGISKMTNSSRSGRQIFPHRRNHDLTSVITNQAGALLPEDQP